MKKITREKNLIIGKSQLAIAGCLVLALILPAWGSSRLLVLNAASGPEDKEGDLNPVQQEDF